VLFEGKVSLSSHHGRRKWTRTSRTFPRFKDEIFDNTRTRVQYTLGVTTKNLRFEFDRSEVDLIPNVIGEVHRPPKGVFEAGQPEAPTQRWKLIDSGGGPTWRGQFALEPLDGQVIKVWELQSELEDGSVMAERTKKREGCQSGIEMNETAFVMELP
jgi:hypothetical protein